jgi:Mg2+ and Co2+ transporter CorA
MQAEKCVLCCHDDREQIEHQLLTNQVPKTLVAAELHMSVEDVYDHMRNHLDRVLQKQTDTIEKIFSKRDILFSNMMLLKDRLNSYLERDKFSASETAQIVKMASEIRRTVIDLATLEGELKQEQQITLVQFNQLKNVVISALCEKCRAAVLEELEKQALEIEITT